MTTILRSCPVWSKGPKMESDLNNRNHQTESNFPDNASIEAQILDLRLRVDALSRRVEELEATTFQLVDEEEIILFTVHNT